MQVDLNKVVMRLSDIRKSTTDMEVRVQIEELIQDLGDIHFDRKDGPSRNVHPKLLVNEKLYPETR